MTKLSVNINKIALLRNSRGRNFPDVRAFAARCLQLGAHGITLHPREDQRHARYTDVHELQALCQDLGAELNVEGYPSPEFLAVVGSARPAQCTLVPDSDAQITSDHGFDLRADAARLKPLIADLKSARARVSLFVDAGCAEVERAAELGADRIEIYTGPYARAFANGDHARELAACVDTARRAKAAGLGVNAGHDLNQANLGAFCKAIPYLAEVSIGHALIGEALYDGLVPTVRNYLRLLEG